jgi:hypothetical protein
MSNELIPREVPAYEKHIFWDAKTKYAVLIPVINEGGRIQAQLRKMMAVPGMPDIIIGDGGSKDGSLDFEFLKECNVRTLLVKTGRGKLSAQLRMLFDFALKEGYAGVVTIDGNNKDSVESIPHFVAALEAGFDYLQGSRYIKGGKEINTPWDRKLGLKYIHAPLISLAARHRYTDTTNGFRGINSRILKDPRVQPFRDIFDTYNLHYYLSIRTARLGYRIKEIPVTRAYPNEGPTPSKIGGFAGKFHVLKQMFLACIGAYNPK